MNIIQCIGFQVPLPDQFIIEPLHITVPDGLDLLRPEGTPYIMVICIDITGLRSRLQVILLTDVLVIKFVQREPVGKGRVDAIFDVANDFPFFFSQLCQAFCVD